MAENSKIEWTDHTFNPWTGCTKVSPGCDHCYAEGWDIRGCRVIVKNSITRKTSKWWAAHVELVNATLAWMRLAEVSDMAVEKMLLRHPDSPGMRVPVMRGRLGRLLKPAEFATTGEVLAYYRALELVTTRAVREGKEREHAHGVAPVRGESKPSAGTDGGQS